MHTFQPYHDVPAIEYGDNSPLSDPFAHNDNIEEYSDYWSSRHSNFESHQSIEGIDDASAAHLVSMERRLYNLTNSVNGHGSRMPIKTPEYQFSRLGIHTPFSAGSSGFRGPRYLSPSGHLGGSLSEASTDSNTSDYASSQDATNQFPFQGPFHNQEGFQSPSYNGNNNPGHGNWVPHSPFQTALIRSPQSYDHAAACNMKDLQYTPDVILEEDDNDCIKVEAHYPEELALSSETPTSGISPEANDDSAYDDASLKDEDEDDDRNQHSDEDSEYDPRYPERKMSSSQVKSPARKSPRRTRSITNAVQGTESRVTKPSHRKNSSVYSRSGRATTKSSGDQQKRQFDCAFHFWGCDSTFGSKNEWKRHVSSQHLQLEYYRCDTGLCYAVSPSKSYNDFNRKDLFTQHHRRMHTPWAPSAPPPNNGAKQDFEDSLEAVRQRCLRERRKAPQRSQCGFCKRVFEGPNSWEERMEHVGKHYEGKGSGNGNREAEEMKDEEDEDEDLRAWAVKEGIVKDLGTRGFWLEGLAPADCQNGRHGSRRERGQRAQHQQQIKDEVNEDDDDTDAHGEEE